MIGFKAQSFDVATPVYCPKAESHLPNVQGNINQLPLLLPKGLQDLPQYTFLHHY